MYNHYRTFKLLSNFFAINGKKIVYQILANFSIIVDTGISETKLKKIYRTFYDKMLKSSVDFTELCSGNTGVPKF